MRVGQEPAAYALCDDATWGHKQIYDECDTPAARAFYSMRRARHFHDAWKHACHADRAFAWRIMHMRTRNACMGVSR